MSGRLRAWLELGRVSRLPVWISGATAGFYLGGGSIEGAPGLWLAFLAAASCLYLAASILSNLCDQAADRSLHPGRPLVSGRIGALSAWIATIALVMLGLGIVQVVFPRAMGAAFGLLVFMYAYSFLHHRLPLSPFLRGACRGALYVMAAAAAGKGLVDGSVWGSALGLGGYVWAISVFARREPHLPLVPQRVLGAIAVFGVLPLPALAPWGQGPLWSSRPLLVAATLMAALWLFSVARTLRSSAKPEVAMGKLIAGVCLLDALVLARLGSLAGATLAAVSFALAVLLQPRSRTPDTAAGDQRRLS
ncbi:MAG: UbiA family prenyltransferase [Oligoflexia bacterium]|nr:UbiA family prenyltransferase [Oligoflexia bacterium]